MSRLAGSAARPMAVLALVALLGAALAGCGKSKEQRAKEQVCAARADIQQQIGQLTSSTAGGSLSISAIKANLSAIKGDLQKIKDAQPDLKPQRKQQVQQALSVFESQVIAAGKQALSSLNADKLKANVTAAAQQLSASFKQAFGPIDCPAPSS